MSLEMEAKLESKPVTHLLRRIVEDYATLYGLPRSAYETLEADCKAMALDRREYFKELLDHRYRQVLAKGPGTPMIEAAPATTASSRKK